MNEDIVIPIAFFGTVVVLALGIPLVRAYIRRLERVPPHTSLSPELSLRLDRLESMVETVAVEVERMSEGQRFTTRLLSEGAALPRAEQVRDTAPPVKGTINEVTHA
jgi:hypothetical protein